MGATEIIALVLQYGLKYGPEAAAIARKLLTKKDLPTDAEWAELDAILLKTKDDYFAPRLIL